MSEHLASRAWRSTDTVSLLSAARSRIGRVPVDLVGRSAELAILDEALARLPHAGGDAVMIHGDAGVGKSALLAAVRSRASARGYLVLTATGVASETAWPYAGLQQLIAPLLDGCEQLPRRQRSAISVAFGMADTGAIEPFIVGLAAVNLLTGSAARRPVVLVVDDIQSLDAPSQDALAFIGRRAVDDRVLIVGAARGAPVDTILETFSRDIAIGPLDDASARDLLDRQRPDLGGTEREGILALAVGNPLALVELAAVGPLSPRLARAFIPGLDDLPDPTRAVLLVAAVSDDESAMEILAAAGMLAGSPIPVDALDAAVDAGLLRSERMRIRFRHPLSRTGVLRGESNRRRQAAHVALAEVLADDPFRSAWHRAQGTVEFDDAVAEDLEQMHTVSIDRGSVAGAIAALERAAELTSDPALRGRRLLLAAEHAFGLGRPDTVRRLLAAATRNVLPELEAARGEWLREVFHDGVPGDAPQVTELCNTARAAAGAGDADLAHDLLLGAALRCWWAETGQIAPRRVVLETQRLVSDRPDPRHVATLALAEPLRQSRRVGSLLTRLDAEGVTDADALRLLGQAAHAAGDPVRAVDFLDRAEARLREQGRLGLLAHVLAMSASDRLELGYWERVPAVVGEARRVARETGQPLWAAGAMSLEAMAAGLAGDLDRAHDLAARIELFANERRLSYLLARVQLARGFALTSGGRHAPAYAAFRRLFDVTDPCHHGREKLRGVMYLAEAAVRADRVPDARELLGEIEELAGASPALDRQLAYSRAVLADDDRAEELFRSALDADLARWPLMRARLQLSHGSWLRRQRRSAESRDPLREAAMTFGALGAAAWSAVARGELRAAGEVTAGAARPAAHELLSAQELEVARLAAEGLSNKQIGERLYLSPRTVGSHLYRIFPKLDITSRGQLAARLSRS